MSVFCNKSCFLFECRSQIPPALVIEINNWYMGFLRPAFEMSHDTKNLRITEFCNCSKRGHRRFELCTNVLMLSVQKFSKR